MPKEAKFDQLTTNENLVGNMDQNSGRKDFDPYDAGLPFYLDQKYVEHILLTGIKKQEQYIEEETKQLSLNIVPLDTHSFVKNFKQMPLLEHDGQLY